MTSPIQPQSAITLATDIVSAYVSNNSVPEDKLTDLIKQVHRTVREAGNEGADGVTGTEKPTAAQIRKSITEDALISFIDGKPYKTLKRHLTLKGLTPDQYKLKYGLPPDYPMIASSYSRQRSDLAKMLGLGQRGRAASQVSSKIDEIAGEPIGATAAPALPAAETETAQETGKTSRRSGRTKTAAPAAAGADAAKTTRRRASAAMTEAAPASEAAAKTSSTKGRTAKPRSAKASTSQAESAGTETAGQAAETTSAKPSRKKATSRKASAKSSRAKTGGARRKNQGGEAAHTA